MSALLMGLIFYAKIDPTDKLVLLALADHGTDEGESIYPSIELLRIKTSFSRRTVQIALRRLSGKDIITIRRNAGQETARGATNAYKISVEKLLTMLDPKTPLKLIKRLATDISTDEVSSVPEIRGVVDAPLGVHLEAEGVHLTTSRGAPRAHESSLNINKSAEEGGMPEQSTLRQTKSRRTKPGNSRSKHPAILMAKDIGGGRYPPIEIYEDIIRVVGDSPDVENAVACRKEWVRRGYNGQNWNWLLEWYPDGIPIRAVNGSRGETKLQRSLRNIDELRKAENVNQE